MTGPSDFHPYHIAHHIKSTFNKHPAGELSLYINKSNYCIFVFNQANLGHFCFQ